MRKLLLIIGFLSLFALEAKCDTIDFWHIYYNGNLIGKFSQNENGEIVIKQSNIKAGDKIEIEYWRDAPCGECTQYFTVENSSSKKASVYSFKFRQKVIIKVSTFMLADHIGIYEFYESVGEPYPKEPHLLFKLRVE